MPPVETYQMSYKEDKPEKLTTAESTAEYGIPTALGSIWATIQTLSPSNRQWLAEHILEQQEDDGVRSYAKKICTREEYMALEQEGFLDNPTCVDEPQSEFELQQEIEKFHRGGYMSPSETADFFNRLIG